MEKHHRREFLKKSLAGVSAAAFLPGYVSTSFAGLVSESGEQESIAYRTLGKTGLKLPVISLGTSNIKTPGLVLEAMNSGIKLFTTSSYYGEGNNEIMLSEVIKNRPRDSFLIGTGSMPQGIDHQNGIFTDTNAAAKYRSDIEGGLKRLGLDYVDIIFLSFTAKRESIFFEPFLRMMEDFKKQGKCRFLATTTHSFCDEAIRAAVDTKIYDMTVTAYNFRTEKVKDLDDSIAFAVKSGHGILCMKSQAGGFWDKERKDPINSQAAIKWVLQNENITTVLSGMSTEQQLKQNIGLMSDLKFTDKEKNDLRLTSSEKVPGLYCQQCKKCIPQCPKNWDIPTAMRSFMYAYGYRDLTHAKETFGYTNIPADPCGSCERCSVNCTMGFDIRSRIQDIARVNNVPDDFISA